MPKGEVAVCWHWVEAPPHLRVLVSLLRGRRLSQFGGLEMNGLCGWPASRQRAAQQAERWPQRSPRDVRVSQPLRLHGLDPRLGYSLHTVCLLLIHCALPVVLASLALAGGCPWSFPSCTPPKPQAAPARRLRTHLVCSGSSISHIHIRRLPTPSAAASVFTARHLHGSALTTARRRTSPPHPYTQRRIGLLRACSTRPCPPTRPFARNSCSRESARLPATRNHRGTSYRQS